MSLNKFGILCTWLLAVTAQAEPVKCPSFSANVALSGAIVYDGTPEEMADLMPDASKSAGKLTTSLWKVGYIFDAGRQVNLVCKYGATATLKVPVEKKVQTCIYRSHAGKQTVEMFCK